VALNKFCAISASVISLLVRTSLASAQDAPPSKAMPLGSEASVTSRTTPRCSSCWSTLAAMSARPWWARCPDVRSLRTVLDN
jgi:hypothetical protein